jgi:hypothetical protein
MSSAFAELYAALAEDPNLGVEALHTQASGGPALAVRVVLSAPDSLGTLDAAGVVQTEALVTLPIATLATVAEGDVFEIGGQIYQVQAVQRDAHGVAWSLPCRKRSPATPGSIKLGSGL